MPYANAQRAQSTRTCRASLGFRVRTRRDVLSFERRSPSRLRAELCAEDAESRQTSGENASATSIVVVEVRDGGVGGVGGGGGGVCAHLSGGAAANERSIVRCVSDESVLSTRMRDAEARAADANGGDSSSAITRRRADARAVDGGDVSSAAMIKFVRFGGVISAISNGAALLRVRFGVSGANEMNAALRRCA